MLVVKMAHSPWSFVEKLPHKSTLSHSFSTRSGKVAGCMQILQPGFGKKNSPASAASSVEFQSHWIIKKMYMPISVFSPCKSAFKMAGLVKNKHSSNKVNQQVRIAVGVENFKSWIKYGEVW